MNDDALTMCSEDRSSLLASKQNSSRRENGGGLWSSNGYRFFLPPNSPASVNMQSITADRDPEQKMVRFANSIQITSYHYVP